MAENARIIIVGAGPAGVRAAQTLVDAGHRPLVLDEGLRPGGQIYRRPPGGFVRSPRALYGFEAARAVALHETAGLLETKADYRPQSLVWSVEPRVRQLTILSHGQHHRLAYDALLLATGAMDRVLPLPGWTLPGVFTLGGAQVALKFQGCAIGHRVAFLGTGPLLYLVAWQYAKAGAEVAAVLDTAPRGAKVRALTALVQRPGTLAKGLWYVARLRSHNIPVHTGVRPRRIEGRERVQALVVSDRQGTERTIACDGLAVGFGLRPETQLADLADVPFDFDPLERQWLPRCDGTGRTPVPGIYIAGDGARIGGADAAELAGELAARALLADRGDATQDTAMRRLSGRLVRHRRFREALEIAFPFPARLAADLSDETLLCRCEGIKVGELRSAARDLGATEINRAKAFCRVGMGRCQGRVCGPAAAEILSDTLGVPLEAVGRLRGQPPVKPVPVAPTVETMSVNRR